MFGLREKPETDEQGRELTKRCLECDAVGEMKQVRSGDESWDYCGACLTIEGLTDFVVADE